MKIDASSMRLLDHRHWQGRMFGLGILGLLASLTGYFVSPKQFFYSYLFAFVFWLSLVLGSLFFVMLHHLTAATWSVVFRRLAENVASVWPILAILFLPMLAGIREIFPWSNQALVNTAPILMHKSPYLNVGFFIIRAVSYFGVWGILAKILVNTSLASDHNYTEQTTRRLRRTSAVGMILFALTLTFSSFDWLLSLDPYWYSSIFGIYFFAGSFLAALASVAVISFALFESGPMKQILSVEHYHDLGKMIFAFTVFWAYIAFSQYFLIWYANIPEETAWYARRGNGAWFALSLALALGHFLVPFLALITRSAKRNPKVLVPVSLWLIAMHAVDVYWMVMPNLHHEGLRVHWLDLSTFVGVGGLFLWLLLLCSASRPLIAVGDPRLPRSLTAKSDIA